MKIMLINVLYLAFIIIYNINIIRSNANNNLNDHLKDLKNSFCGFIHGNWTSFTSSKIININDNSNIVVDDDDIDNTDKGFDNIKNGKYEFFNSKMIVKSFNGNDKSIEEAIGSHKINGDIEGIRIHCTSDYKGSFFSKGRTNTAKSDNNNNDDPNDEAFSSSINNNEESNEEIILFNFDLQVVSPTIKYSQGIWKPSKKTSSDVTYQLFVDYSALKFTLIITKNDNTSKDSLKHVTIITANKIIEDIEKPFLTKYGPMIGVAAIMALNAFIRIQTSRFKSRSNPSGIAPGPAIAKLAANNRKAGLSLDGSQGATSSIEPDNNNAKTKKKN